MKILIKKATIIDPNSSHHMQTKDLLVENGASILVIGDNMVKTMITNNMTPAMSH